MNSVRAWVAGLCAVPVAAVTVLAPAPATALEKVAAARKVLRAGPPGSPTFVRPEAPTRAQAGFRAQAANFRITYRGFTPAARAAFQRAANIWAQRLASPVPITVSASFRPLAADFLGDARPSFYWPAGPGTYYVDALANKRRGAQRDPSPDIVARFSSNVLWHFGTGPAPANKYDFTSVALHELGHGLGFHGAGSVSGPRGTVRHGRLPLAYDRFTENRAGTSLLTGFANNSAALATQLRGNNLFFDSPQVRAANGNVRARIYAPATFQPGSSYSHLDENTYLAGNANSLMTPALGPGETIRRPGPITLAIFNTLGW